MKPSDVSAAMRLTEANATVSWRGARLVKIKGAVVLCTHPSRAGLQSDKTALDAHLTVVNARNERARGRDLENRVDRLF
jgi:hypothetical protein